MAQLGRTREWLVLGAFVVLAGLGARELWQRQRRVEIPLPPPSESSLAQSGGPPSLPLVTATIPFATATVSVGTITAMTITPAAVAPSIPGSASLKPTIKQFNDETLPAPNQVKAIYATAYTALSPGRLIALIDLIQKTELNAIVINVKDGERTFLDGRMAAAVRQLRQAGVYPIARLVVFQDNELARRQPAVALRRSDGSLWDGGGYYWVDPASQIVWDENVRAAEAALALGFAEINLDYIRFPADGPLDQIVYPVFNQVASSSAISTEFVTQEKTSIIRSFLDYFVESVKGSYPEAIISADVFGYTFLSDTDLGIGQRVVELADAVDVLAPMVYPSHFSPQTFGYPNPAAAPYEVVRRSLEAGLKRLLADGHDVIIRPWLQDFNLGAVYDAVAVQEEIRAVSDAGLNAGWMIWSPQNTYDRENFEPER